MEQDYQGQYYDNYGMLDGQYMGQDIPMNEYIEDFQEQPYFENFYEAPPGASSMALTQSGSYDRLPTSPDTNMYYPDPKQYNTVQYYAAGDLGYQPYLSEIQNTASTTYSYQNLRKSQLELFLHIRKKIILNSFPREYVESLSYIILFYQI